MMLSEREREILSLACLSNKQIAKKLNISYKTVERYFADMFAKTKTARRTELLLKAIKHGELHIVDLGYYNILGQYVEDLQIVDLRKEGANDG